MLVPSYTKVRSLAGVQSEVPEMLDRVVVPIYTFNVENVTEPTAAQSYAMSVIVPPCPISVER